MEGEQLEDRRSVGASSCNCGEGTDQRGQSLMFMMLINNNNSNKSIENRLLLYKAVVKPIWSYGTEL